MRSVKAEPHVLEVPCKGATHQVLPSRNHLHLQWGAVLDATWKLRSASHVSHHFIQRADTFQD